MYEAFATFDRLPIGQDDEGEGALRWLDENGKVVALIQPSDEFPAIDRVIYEAYNAISEIRVGQRVEMLIWRWRKGDKAGTKSWGWQNYGTMSTDLMSGGA